PSSPPGRPGAPSSSDPAGPARRPTPGTVRPRARTRGVVPGGLRVPPGGRPPASGRQRGAADRDPGPRRATEAGPAQRHHGGGDVRGGDLGGPGPGGGTPAGPAAVAAPGTGDRARLEEVDPDAGAGPPVRRDPDQPGEP